MKNILIVIIIIILQLLTSCGKKEEVELNCYITNNTDYKIKYNGYPKSNYSKYDWYYRPKYSDIKGTYIQIYNSNDLKEFKKDVDKSPIDVLNILYDSIVLELTDNTDTIIIKFDNNYVENYQKNLFKDYEFWTYLYEKEYYRELPRAVINENHNYYFAITDTMIKK